MNDPVLEKKILYVERFIKLWNQYYRQFDEGLPEEVPATAERELAFRNTKARICLATQTLRHLLGAQFELRKDIMKVVGSTVSFGLLKEESPIRINNVRSTWHQVFIALNRLQGTLKIQAEETADLTPFQLKMRQLKQNKGLKIALIAGGAVLILIILAVVAVLATGVLN